MNARFMLSFAISALWCATHCETASAAVVNWANGTPVIGGSGDYSNGDFNTGGGFDTQNVTNGQNATPDNDTGGITEPDQDGSYWLGRQGVSSGYFVIDLGTPRAIGSFEIFNTRNGPYDDRGTGDFEIYGSNSLVASGTPGYGSDLGGAVALLAAGTLTEQTYPGGFGSQGNTPIVSDVFASGSTGPFRYIRFNALSVGAANDRGFAIDNGLGLNELRVLSPVPEPGTFLLGVVSLLGILLVHRCR